MVTVRERHFGSLATGVARRLFASVALVASLGAAASPGVSEDVPIPGGIAALARAIELDPAPDHARFVAELVRLVYDDSKAIRESDNSKYRRLIVYLDAQRNAGATVHAQGPLDVVPIPLPAPVWSQVLRRPVAPDRLFAAVISDEAAALLVHGLAALDDETLRFFSDHPALVRRLHEEGASAFADFAAHLAVHDGRISPPGGDLSIPLWEAAIGEKVSDPARFIRALFTRDHGRFAYLYDTISALDSSRTAFALGFWIPDMKTRIERFASLASAVSSIAEEWSVERTPFRRPTHDLVSVFLRVQVTVTGAPEAPAGRAFWARVFADNSGDARVAAPGSGAVIDAAWLVETVLRGNVIERSERLDQFAFGQRVLAGSDSPHVPDALATLRALPRFRMLMLTLERMGVRRPELYAALVHHAEGIANLDIDHARAALAGFQGSIALLERVTRVRTIDGPTAEHLLETLAAVPLTRDRGYMGELVTWLQSQLLPALGDGPLEDRLLDALAGAPGATSVEPVSWEGRQYRLDLVAAERRRLRQYRGRQGRCSIEAAIDLRRIAERVAAPIASSDARTALITWRQTVTLPSETQDVIDKALEDLARTPGSMSADRATGVKKALLGVADVVLGEALLSIVYETNFDVPRGAWWAAARAAGRHDFGLGQPTQAMRVRSAWALPRRVAADGMTWHITGAALGLDVAVPTFALRRIDSAPPAKPPAIVEVERDAFAAGVALMNPFALHNDDLAAIAQAVGRGQGRVDALIRGDGDASALTRDIGMDGWRRRVLQWYLDHDRTRIRSLFSMTDLLYLGGGRNINLDAWGMPALDGVGCMCTRLAAPGVWTALVGRPQVALLPMTVADLNLQVAIGLGEMRLPAALAKSVLAIAVQEFLIRVQVAHVDDWLGRVRAAQDIPRERIEDYVSVATIDGPLIPDVSATHTEP